MTPTPESNQPRLIAGRNKLTCQVSVLPGAERTAMEAFCEPIVDDLAPASDFELQLARNIAEAQWRLNRVRAMEDNYFALHIADYADHDLAGGNEQIANALHVSRAFFENHGAFNALSVFEQRVQRAMAKNIRLLNEAKQARLPAPKASDGFVISNKEISAARASAPRVPSRPELADAA
jgi:hypothetical protein